MMNYIWICGMLLWVAVTLVYTYYLGPTYTGLFCVFLGGFSAGIGYEAKLWKIRG